MQIRISRCISEGLCKEDQDFLKQTIWKEQWKRVIYLPEINSRKVNRNEVAQSLQASEYEDNQNSYFNETLERVTESETFAEEQTNQSFTVQTTDATGSSENVRAIQVHGSDQNEDLYITWSEIMFLIPV